MSDYLYAVIPYNSGLRFKDDAEDKFVERMPKDIKGYDIEFEKDLFQMFSDFILINTCWRMSSLTCDENGRCDARSAIYIVARLLNAKEVWYVGEMCTDEMFRPDFNFDDWKRSLIEENAYCTKEVTLDMLRSGHWASYCHDDFSDIVIDQKYLTNVLENRQFFYDKAEEVAKAVFDIDYDRFISLESDSDKILYLCNNSEDLPYPLHFITICWDIIFGYVLDEWKEEYKTIVSKRKAENDKFIAFFRRFGLEMTGIPFLEYWDIFYCDEPEATVEDCLDLTEDQLKKKGFRDIDIELACCVNKFLFERVEQLLKQGGDPLKDWSENEHYTCVTRIYSEIQFILSYFVGKILGKEKLDNCERDLCDLFCLTAHEKMNHLLDKYYL